jgi:hypothetical protein
MSEVVVVGAFVARDGQGGRGDGRVPGAGRAHARRGRVHPLRPAPGNDDPRKLAFVERWESRDLLNAHLESDHVKGVLAVADDLFSESDITVYDALPGGEHKKGSLAAHAGG